MATTTKTRTPRSSSTNRSATGTSRSSSSSNAGSANAGSEDSIVARAGRSFKERPYTSAAIATGAVTVAAAATAAGAFLLSRRDKSFKEASAELTSRVKDGIASAGASAKGLGQRGTGFFRGNGNDSNRARSQHDISEEALTLKETGSARNAREDRSTNIKAGAIAY